MKMPKWVGIVSSNCGRRKSNDDFVAIRTYYHKRRRITALIACDGVGSRPEGKACAIAMGKESLQIIESYLRHRHSGKTLNNNDAKRLASRLSNLNIKGITNSSATTLVLALVDHRRRKSEHNIIVLWAGDSRAYILDIKGQAIQISLDHHDDEGSLTCYFTGDGRLYGEIEATHYSLKNSLHAIWVTTDGVHAHCQPEELNHFILYCISQRFHDSDNLTQMLSEFLSDTMSDNFSLALLYQSLSPCKITKITANY